MRQEIRIRFRHAILEQLAAASTMGLTIDTLRAGCNFAGVQVTSDDVEAECEGYLQTEGFLSSVPSPIHAAAKRYRITAAGRSYLSLQGLA